MANKKNESIAMDIVNSCQKIDRNIAIKGVRTLCRHFGGCILYIPKKKKNGKTITEMYKVLYEAVGDHNANIIMDKVIALFGSYPVYIPVERRAFQDEIAVEIYLRAGEDGSVSEIGRYYGLCFTAAYKLWKKGQRIKLNREKEK